MLSVICWVDKIWNTISFEQGVSVLHVFWQIREIAFSSFTRCLCPLSPCERNMCANDICSYKICIFQWQFRFFVPPLWSLVTKSCQILFSGVTIQRRGFHIGCWWEEFKIYLLEMKIIIWFYPLLLSSIFIDIYSQESDFLRWLSLVYFNDNI